MAPGVRPAARERSGLRAGMILVVAALCADAGHAGAAEDAGTGSIFARGAGNRAFGMGSAFVASADDASALIWNPAGLAYLKRAELEAAQSSDLGLGMSDGYAILALPSWRWGAVGMSFRHFGVGGIEQRDSRNVLLAENLGDSEFEMGLGYGRRLGEAWSVGGALKLQHQSLAGFSGGGLGMDFGVTARPAAALGLDLPWAENLSWGLALRNAVEPAIRLDQESVSDPMVLRTGLAWRTLLPTGGELLAEIDLSRSAGVSPRMHAGLEFRAHPSAALRLGVNHGVLTAGTGLRWRDLSFDYAYQDNPISAEHRAGVTLGFGATTQQSRMAHRRREDERIEHRLDEGFRQRQSEQVAGLLERVAQSRAQGDFDGALELLALASALEPGAPGAAALETAVLKDRALALERAEDFAAATLSWNRALTATPGDTAAAAGVARCRAESDQRARRTSEIRDQFALAMDAYAAGDLPVARTGFRVVLTAEPADAEARRMLQRTEHAIARRAEGLADQAASALRGGALETAASFLAQAEAFDRSAAGVAETAQTLARARQAEAGRALRSATRPDSARAPARPVANEASKLSDREVEDLYQRGLAALRAQRDEDALRYWELVWSERPGYREVNTYLKREYLTRGMESFASGRLDDAVAQWELVLRVDPADARARGYLERAQKQRLRSREILGAGR